MLMGLAAYKAKHFEGKKKSFSSPTIFPLQCAGLGAICVCLWVWIELSNYESRDGIIALIGPLYYVANFTPLAEGGAIFFIIAVGAIGLCFKSRRTLVWVCIMTGVQTRTYFWCYTCFYCSI